MVDAEEFVLGEQRITVIGCGSMGSALIRGFCRSGVIPSEQITAFDVDSDLLFRLSGELGVTTSTDVVESVSGANFIILAVKPSVVPRVLEALPELRMGFPSPLLVSIAAGVRLESVEKGLGSPVRAVRVMPNLACSVGRGVTCLYAPDESDISPTEQLFNLLGSTLVLNKEEDLDCATGLSGSGPAFVSLMIEALADGGVRVGLPRETALRLAAETALGAASLMLEEGISPAELKNKVASPGGTTIAGLHVLEKGALRGTIMSAVEAAAARSREQGS